MNRNLAVSIYRRPSIKIANIVPIRLHLIKRLQRRLLLEIDQPETRIAYGGHACLLNRFEVAELILLCHQVNYKFHQLLLFCFFRLDMALAVFLIL